MNQFIENLPKIELHIHLEGSINHRTLEKLIYRNEGNFYINKYNLISDTYRYPNLSDFVYIFHEIIDKSIRLPEDYERIAYELFLDLNEQNV